MAFQSYKGKGEEGEEGEGEGEEDIEKGYIIYSNIFLDRYRDIEAQNEILFPKGGIIYYFVNFIMVKPLKFFTNIKKRLQYNTSSTYKQS